jgi:hypothetical protein
LCFYFYCLPCWPSPRRYSRWALFRQIPRPFPRQPKTITRQREVKRLFCQFPHLIIPNLSFLRDRANTRSVRVVRVVTDTPATTGPSEGSREAGAYAQAYNRRRKIAKLAKIQTGNRVRDFGGCVGSAGGRSEAAQAASIREDDGRTGSPVYAGAARTVRMCSADRGRFSVRQSAGIRSQKSRIFHPRHIDS